MSNDEEQGAREIAFDGKTLKEALRDQQAQVMTGYKYDHLVKLVEDDNNEDGLDIEELDDVNKSVNTLAHLFVYFAKKNS